MDADSSKELELCSAKQERVGLQSSAGLAAAAVVVLEVCKWSPLELFLLVVAQLVGCRCFLVHFVVMQVLPVLETIVVAGLQFDSDLLAEAEVVELEPSASVVVAVV